MILDLFSIFLGVSGGLKWFILFGFDKYLFGEFFKEWNIILNLLGLSVGVFRVVCFV